MSGFTFILLNIFSTLSMAAFAFSSLINSMLLLWLSHCWRILYEFNYLLMTCMHCFIVFVVVFFFPFFFEKLCSTFMIYSNVICYMGKICFTLWFACISFEQFSFKLFFLELCTKIFVIFFTLTLDLWPFPSNLYLTSEEGTATPESACAATITAADADCDFNSVNTKILSDIWIYGVKC
jgi:hypothetical protein